MPKPNQDAVRKVVNPEHHNWVSTDSIKAKLAAAYPKLEFPWLDKEHIHGVNSIVSGVCREHHQVVPMLVGNLWRETTKYGCHECALTHGGEFEGHAEFNIRRNHPNYKGQSKMEFNLFCVIKEEFPDALAHHKMKGRKEIDIWIPSIRAGVEYNGNHYHAEGKGRGEFYHFDKSTTAWQQDKFILHLFTEEGENYKAVLETLRLFSLFSSKKKPIRKTFQFGPISDGSARAFHKSHNPVIDFNTPDWNWHLGVYDEQFNTVGVFSGVKEYGVITKITVTDFNVQVGAILKKFCRSTMGNAAVFIDSRNPLELFLVKTAVELVPCRGLPPLPLPMDKGYKIISIRDRVRFENLAAITAKQPEEIDRAWDVGRLGYFINGHKPYWVK